MRSSALAGFEAVSMDTRVVASAPALALALALARD
jgi:hypothetical protein